MENTLKHFVDYINTKPTKYYSQSREIIIGGEKYIQYPDGHCELKDN